MIRYRLFFSSCVIKRSNIECHEIPNLQIGVDSVEKPRHLRDAFLRYLSLPGSSKGILNAYLRSQLIIKLVFGNERNSWMILCECCSLTKECHDELDVLPAFSRLLCQY